MRRFLGFTILLVLTYATARGEEKPRASTQTLPNESSKKADSAESADRPLSKILFGSCIKQDLPTPIFTEMLQEKADLAIFLGDNIYADTADMQVMRAEYAKLGRNPLFEAFRSSCPCLATWDDHDFGLNDGGADFVMRDAAQRVFLDFWEDPLDSVRRQRAGVYDSVILGPAGKRTQIILLDTRYFRSPLKKGAARVGGAYVPDVDPAKTMLGDAQWQWLEDQLKKPANVRIIATSIQCLPSDAGQETWANFPAEQRRLFSLIAKTKAAGVFIISGDRHWAELSSITQDVPYPFYEMTSSSFNQLHKRGTPTENSNRADPRTFHQENYGVIAIDWQLTAPTVSLEVRDLQAMTQIRKELDLSELQPADSVQK
jgi:alkaline phosphatase D